MTASRLPQKTGVLIVGAGIIGLTLARELAARGWDDITVIEKEPVPGRHASGRNSGVLHAGIYYSPDSLKAQMCLKGNRLMRRYCREKGLPLLEKGKVIVARSAAELPVLAELHRRATANGARVELIDTRQLAEIEPHAQTAGQALFSHDTAQVDPRAVLQSLKDELVAGGRVNIVCSCSLIGLHGSRSAVTTAGRIGFERVVNCAGAHCDRVARVFGLGRHLRLIPFKGIYRKLKKGASCAVNGNIYPVPDIRNPFLGVHFTRGIHGDVYIGPTAIPAFGRENYGLLAGIDAEALSIAWSDAVLFCRNAKFRTVAVQEPRKYIGSFLIHDARQLVKQIDAAQVEPCNKVGIRAQLVDWRTKELVMDFVVQADGDAVHVLNPVSPAFTCSMEMARQIAQAHF